MAKGYKKAVKVITQELFDQVKMLQAGGLSAIQTRAVMKLGDSTIAKIRKVADYEEYKVYRTNHNKSYDKPVAEEPITEVAPSLVVTSLHDIAMAIRENTHQLELLTQAWNNKSEKKGIFGK